MKESFQPKSPEILIDNYPELSFDDYVNAARVILDADLNDFKKKNLTKNLLKKKQILIYLLREVYKTNRIGEKKRRFSLLQIQDVTKLKSHATVIHNYNKVKFPCYLYKQDDKKISELKNQLNQILRTKQKLKRITKKNRELWTS